MNPNPTQHHRSSIRLKGYDYALPGAYFVTLVTQGRLPVFGEISNGEIQLNEFGLIARDEWLNTPTLRPNVELGEFIIMPNHIHGIIIITDRGISGANESDIRRDAPDLNESDARRGVLRICRGVLQYAPTNHAPSTPTAPTNHAFRSPSQTIGAIVRGYKSVVARRVNLLRETPGAPLWQRNYYEHIIRDQAELESISLYIEANPVRWETDAENILGLMHES